MSSEHPRAELRLFPAPPSARKRSSSRKRGVPGRRSASVSRTPLEERVASPVSPEDGRGRQSSLGERYTPSSQSQLQEEGESQSQSQTEQQTYTQNLDQHQTYNPPQTHNQFKQQTQPAPASSVTMPPPVAQPTRSQTSFSEAPTLVRTNSHEQGEQQIKHAASPPREKDKSMMHSIFPRYNPDLPLEYQPYYPNPQASSPPAQLPPAILNRRPYSPSLVERSPNGFQSPMPVGLSPGLFPRGLQDESVLEPSTSEELKQLWKVCNGWRVSPSEGRRFCLRMNSALEEPVHTLSSSTTPFYTLRLDPTSTSAIVTLTRQDPNKAASKSISPILGSLTSTSSNSKKELGSEVLTTTLEEPSRKLPPNDGLIALLYPRAASNMAIELATKATRSPYATASDSEAVIEAAERECGRLVWDEDSKKYYLVHPVLPTPFYISIHSSPAWSRSEYTLEHPELPRNLIRLVRDGSGQGYLEVDTAVAGRLDCFYIIDVAITAVLLVACAEEKTTFYERFEAPPPSIAPATPLTPKSQLKMDKKEAKEKKKRDKDVRIEEFELDLESQDSISDAKSKRRMKREKKEKEKVPGCFGLLWMIIKFFAWFIGLFFRGLGKVTMFLCRGCKSKREKISS